MLHGAGDEEFLEFLDAAANIGMRSAGCTLRAAPPPEERMDNAMPQAKGRPGQPIRVCENQQSDRHAPGITKSAICIQKFDYSLNSAIHTTYRSWLRSSSMHEPRDPPLKVVNSFKNNNNNTVKR